MPATMNLQTPTPEGAPAPLQQSTTSASTPPPQSDEGSVLYTVSGADAHAPDREVSPKDVIKELKKQGHSVEGVSPDGLSYIMNQTAPNGMPLQVKVPYDGLIKAALGRDVRKVVPTHPDPAGIDAGWGTEVQSLPADDNIKKQFLAQKLKAHGIEGAPIIGGGNEYHAYDAHTGKWVQLTEEPGWNKTGALSALAAAPHLIGMAAGGALGGAAGGPAGAITGGGLGGAIGEGGRQALMSAMDPDYLEAARSNPGPLAEEVGKTGLLDAAGEGAGLGISKAFPGLTQLPGKVVGKGMYYGGKMISGLSDAVAKSPLMTDVATDIASPLSTFSGGSQLAQIPASLLETATKLAAKLPEDSSLGNYARSIYRKTEPVGLGERLMRGSEELGNMVGGPSPNMRPNAKDILGNVGARGKAMQSLLASDPYVAEEAAAGQMAGSAGLDPEETMSSIRSEALNQEMMRPEHQDNWGRSLGGAIEAANQVGRGVDALANIPTKAVLKAGQVGGRAISGAGLGLTIGSNVASPMIAPVAGRYGISNGIPALYDDVKDKVRKHFQINPW